VHYEKPDLYCIGCKYKQNNCSLLNIKGRIPLF